MTFKFPTIAELNDIAVGGRVRQDMANTFRSIADQGGRNASFEVNFSGGRHVIRGVPVRDLITELEPLGYKCALNVDSSDMSYHLDIEF